jgi:hypothetical protein
MFFYKFCKHNAEFIIFKGGNVRNQLTVGPRAAASPRAAQIGWRLGDGKFKYIWAVACPDECQFYSSQFRHFLTEVPTQDFADPGLESTRRINQTKREYIPLVTTILR